jgi:hypothetical protein
MKGVEDQLGIALKPLQMVTQIILPISKKLDDVASKLPENLKTEFDEINSQLAKQLHLISDATTKSTEPVQRDLRELSLSINAMMNKPNLIGVVKEKTLELGWQEVFTKDKVNRRGASGQPDLIVEPFVEIDGGRYGNKIVIERKAGRQRYCGSHLQQLLTHTRAEGARFGMLLYDDVSNLLENQKPISLSTIQEITIAITDIESGNWKTIREIFEVLQTFLPKDTTSPLQKIDLKKFQTIIEEMARLNEQIETIRKSNNATMSNCEKTRNLINRLEESITAYQAQLRDLFRNKTADNAEAVIHVESSGIKQATIIDLN